MSDEGEGERKLPLHSEGAGGRALGGNPKQAAARAGLSLSVYLIKWTLCASY